MTYLSPPQYQPVVTETGQGTLGPAAEAAVGLMGIAKGQIDQGRVDRTTAQMEGVLDGALAVDEDVQEITLDYEKAPEGISALDQNLYSKLNKLQRMQKQGDSSLRALAEIEMKRVLAEAKVKYPSLADKLESQYVGITRYSPKYHELAMLDELNKAEQANITEQRKRIAEIAYKDPDEGGLGIPRNIDMNSYTFARLYNEAAAKRARIDRVKLDLEYTVATRNAKGEDWARTIQDRLTGSASVYNDLNPIFVSASKASTAQQKLAAGQPLTPEESSRLAMWQGGGQQAALGQILSTIAELQEVRARIPFDQRDTPDIKLAIQMVDDHVSVLQTQAKALTEGFTTDFAAAQKLQTDMWTHAFLQDNPALHDVNRLAAVLKPTFEMMQTPGLFDKYVQFNFGSHVTKTVDDAMKKFGIVSVYTSDPRADGLRMAASDPGVITPAGYPPETDPVKRDANAVRALGNTMRMIPGLAEQAQAAGVEVAPAALATMFNTAHAQFLSMYNGPNAYVPQAIDEFGKSLGNPYLVDAVASARRNPNARPDDLDAIVNLGFRAKEYIANMPMDRQDQIVDDFNKSFYGIPFSQFASLDVSKLKDQGTIRFTIDEAKLKKHLDAYYNRTASGAGMSPAEMSRVMANINSHSRQLSDRISGDIRLMANTQFFINTQYERPLYTEAATNNGYLALLRK